MDKNLKANCKIIFKFQENQKINNKIVHNKNQEIHRNNQLIKKVKL